MWIEIRGFEFLERRPKTNPQIKKSLDLDQDSRRNRRMNIRDTLKK